MIGAALSNYRITGELGSGGMGEVWRAEDEKLGREVALKVLPANVAEDPDRLARFEREAKVLASLNHPNIAHLYGLETATLQKKDGEDPAPESSQPVTFLVMELVEGEDLSQRIAKGPIPVDDAITIALQVAEALDAAHERSIVHRDLKPANIKLRPDGAVKVLDFGLAKAWQAGGGDAPLSMTPTLTQHDTAAGVILGTAAYMSPEQARGKSVDRRSDVWAFGAVLWEMLTGRRLFDGDTPSDLMAAVLTAKVNLDQLPADTPGSVRRLLRRCLQRDPQDRLQCLGDARLDLKDAEEATGEAPDRAERRGGTLGWVVAGAMAVIALAAGLAAMTAGGGADQPQVRFKMPAPDGNVYHLEALAPGPATLSPGGEKIAFTLRDVSGRVRLAVRELRSEETRFLDGADGAQYPFWSPDGLEIGFFTRSGAALRVIPAEGGPVRTLCAARNGKGGTWNDDGVIVFTPDSNTPIFSIPAGGGVPTQLTSIDGEAGENSHRHPRFLPDGNRFLYLARNVGGPETHTVRIGALDGSIDAELVHSPVGASYVDGRLLFMDDRRLVSQAFDPNGPALSGEVAELADDVMIIEGAACGVFAATEQVLVIQHGEEHTLSELIWIERSGETIGRVGDVASHYSVALSPGGDKIAVPVTNYTIGTHDLWIYDVGRNLRSRVTFDDAEDLAPVWGPDGRIVYFVSNRRGDLAVFRLVPGETGEPELVIGGERPMTPTSVSPDGERLLLTRESVDAGSDLVVFDLATGGELQPLRATRFNEEQGAFSPDGSWVAYASDESGQFEVYVTSSTGDGRRWQISTEGGLWPKWIPGTGEILYQDAAGRFVVVSIGTRGSLVDIGSPRVLFGGYTAGRLYPAFDPVRDGSRILYRALSNEDPPAPPVVVVNWQEGATP